MNITVSVDTYNNNLQGECHNQYLTVGFEYPEAENIDIIIGGPPCQPFSRFGNQMGMEDARDGFPIFIDAVRRLQPRVFLFENVANKIAGYQTSNMFVVNEYLYLFPDFNVLDTVIEVHPPFCPL